MTDEIWAEIFQELLDQELLDLNNLTEQEIEFINSILEEGEEYRQLS